MTAADLILPFTVPVKDRVKAFTPSMELAAILFLVESRRKKRMLIEPSPKKTLFVSKLHYPLWAVPCESGHVILDGLGILSTSIRSNIPPEVQQFIEDIEKGASAREQFKIAIEKHKNTFKSFAGVSEVQVNALIDDAELLSPVMEFVKEASSGDFVADDLVGLLPPRIDRESATGIAEQAFNIFRQGQSRIRALEYARNLLKEILRLNEQMMLKEAEFLRDAFETEISKFRPAVERKVDQLLNDRDTRVAKMNRVMQNELVAKEKERERRERELRRLELTQADYTRRRESRKRRHDRTGTTQWEHRIRVYENRIEETRSRIRALSEFIEKTRRQTESDIEHLKYGYQALIDQERSKTRDIEAQRDGSIDARRTELENLEFAAGDIAKQIDWLLEQQRRQQDELGKLIVSMPLDDVTLLGLPFYVSSYQIGRRTEFQVFPPFMVTSPEGIVKTLQKTISLRSSAKLKRFLQPKSRALSRMLEFVIKEKTRSDKALSENLLQATSSSNVLEKHNLKEMLAKGVQELKAEGWINQSQGDALVKAYS